ncbi:MAG: hypothetical protein JNJ59_22950 [Deltaproteobacteria bacterium]|nr:hypothetical protein [Deltaproteobacteria bacterium]
MVSHSAPRSRRLSSGLAHASALSLILASTGCLGRVETIDPARTLSFHATQETLEELPTAPYDRAPPKAVQAAVSVATFVPYYAEPVGFFKTDPAFNEVASWAPIVIRPTPEEALRESFARGLTPGAGEALTVRGVVTHFEWHMLGVRGNAGRIATELVVTDASGAVRFRGARTTAIRVPFVDVLFRQHVREWLADPALVAVLGGTTP